MENLNQTRAISEAVQMRVLPKNVNPYTCVNANTLNKAWDGVHKMIFMPCSYLPDACRLDLYTSEYIKGEYDED